MLQQPQIPKLSVQDHKNHMQQRLEVPHHTEQMQRWRVEGPLLGLLQWEAVGEAGDAPCTYCRPSVAVFCSKI